MLRLLKWIFGCLFAVVALLGIIATLFMTLSPQFGGRASAAEELAYAQTGHFKDGIFINDEAIEMEVDCHSIQQMLKENCCVKFYNCLKGSSTYRDMKVSTPVN